MALPLCTVITSTWQRHVWLRNRCVPSVAAQDYPRVEHVIVSDGPDEVLANAPWPPNVRYAQLPVHDAAPHWGHHARLRGLELARGELVAYLDDDDAWEPAHLRFLAQALADDPAAGFAFSRALVHAAAGGTVRIGDGRPAHGRVQTSMLVHRRELTRVATWGPAHPAEDWQLVQAWLAAGIAYASVDAVTVHHYPSQPLDLTRGVPVSFTPPAS
jgi:hypothetical protein